MIKENQRINRAVKRAVLISFCLLLASFLQAQSLVELAEREKERRESLKDRKAMVITNEDLAKIRKRPALDTLEAETVESAEQVAVEEERGLSGPVRRIIPRVSRPGPPLIDKDTAARQASSLEDLEGRLERVRELIELLNLKMNALWQEFYGLDDMTPKDRIQRQLEETRDKLLKAQEEETRIKKQIESGGSWTEKGRS